MPITVFFSYSHVDEELRDQLEKHLTMLRREGAISAWHDRRILAGDEFDGRIKTELNQAGIILFLVSADFLASEYCYSVEIKRGIERHEAGEARCIPVILRPCDWHGAPFGNLLGLPKDGKAITTWTNLDEAFLDVTRGIRAAVESLTPADLETEPGTAKEATETSRRPAMAAPDPRSSNLSVAKEYSDYDREQYRTETFEFTGRFFKNSLEELAARNSDIDIKYRRIDANTFTASVFRGGASISGCTITIGGQIMPGGISYLSDDSGRTDSANAWLMVSADESTLYLMPSGFAVFVGSTSANENSKLTQEGAAEYFWAMFIEPLQRK